MPAPGTSTLQQAIDTAYSVLNDAGGVRYTEDELLTFGNDAIKYIAIARPELFHVVADVPTVSNQTLQQIPADGLALVDIIGVTGGNSTRRVKTREAFDAILQSWPQQAPAPAQNWFQLDSDPVRFMIYPPSPPGQQMTLVYVQAPGEYGINEDLPIPSTYIPIVADYIIGMSQMRDDEHVSSGRAQAFLQQFFTLLGLSKQAQDLSNVPAAGKDPGEKK